MDKKTTKKRLLAAAASLPFKHQFRGFRRKLKKQLNSKDSVDKGLIDKVNKFLEDCENSNDWSDRIYGLRLNSRCDWSKISLPALLATDSNSKMNFIVVVAAHNSTLTYFCHTGLFTQKFEHTLLIFTSCTLIYEQCYLDNPTNKLLANRLAKLADAREPVEYLSTKNRTKKKFNHLCISKFRNNRLLFLRDVFPKSVISRIRKECQTQIKRNGQKPGCKLETGENRFLYPIQMRSSLVQASIYANKLLYPFVTGILGSDFILNSVTCVRAKMDSSFQHFHTDHPDLFENNSGYIDLSQPSFAMVCAIPLGPVNLVNGTTRFAIPVDHTRYSKISFKNCYIRCSYDHHPFTGDIGDCVVYDYRIAHQGTPTLTDQERDILYLVYSKPWFQETTSYRKTHRTHISEACYRQIPKKYRHLFLQSTLHFLST